MMGMQHMEARLESLEGVYIQVADHLNSIDARKAMDQKFTWTVGIVLTTWLTTILAILYHR